jgi:hypothetical protein
MKENLNLLHNKKILVSVALRRFKEKKDAAKALGISTRGLINLRKEWGWP